MPPTSSHVPPASEGTSSTKITGSAEELDATVRTLATFFARTIAGLVVDQLRAADFPGYVDQSSSPLGRRRHIAAVRSGRLPGIRVGRRYLARSSDVDALVRDGIIASQESSSVDDLAADLGLQLEPAHVRKRGA